MIQVDVLFFARARELAGAPRARLLLEEGSTVESAARRLGEEHPSLAVFLPSCRFALDEVIASGPEPLRDGSVLAVIPPVSGG